jgi:hypothetical protein
MASAAVLRPQAPAGSTSAAGVLALLEEEDDTLKFHALQQLDRTVDDFWFQIAASIAHIEALYEDEDFPHRELAALLASKVRDRHHRARPASPRSARLAAPPGLLARSTARRCSTTWATWTTP